MPSAKVRKAFRDIKIGAVLQTECGQVYRKRSARTVEMAPGHSHYDPTNVKWFYAVAGEVWIVRQEDVQGV